MNKCVDCDAEFTNNKRQRCLMCWRKYQAEHRTSFCIDCGKHLISRSRGKHRCRECYNLYLQTRPIHSCSVEGCGRQHRAKGFCMLHYKINFSIRPKGQNRGSNFRKQVSKSPCQICGYNKLPSNVHRIDSKLPYQVGNMVALCYNCHAEVHHGITICPASFQF